MLIALSLEGLARNSTMSHTIILAFSDITEVSKHFPVASSYPMGHRTWSPEIPHPNCFDVAKYTYARELIEKAPFQNYPHTVTVIDTTQKTLEMRERLGPLHIEQMIHSGYADVGIKMNAGIAAAETGKIIPFYEDDYYPCPDWDGRLLRTMEQFPNQAVYCATLVRHWTDASKEPYPIHVNDPWEDFRAMNCHSLWINPPYPCTREQWAAECGKLYKDGVYYELCGERRRSFAFPLLMDTSLARKIAPVPEDGRDPALYFDSACGHAGLMKVVSRQCLIGNKMPICSLASELP